ncbi:GNAT family N-acetyltransferase [Shewanella sedimentimangrovi]|uniref:N-acetyltransferase n=1 Tax=Shewanella sedimentimangrovi TaxID=2814293 RepID=A0ABX7R0X7_9GAMM|nr:GNAT family N-acetyltransferase [Shewanella sedimentimangrovi]QSX36836.1 N-acetyltransferase [Shewanella sedimentimangrovi]
MHFIPCNLPQHGEAILAIFNDAIAHSTALYEYQPRDMARIQAWFEAKQAADYPVIGAVTTEGELMGFASYGPFRGFPVNKYSVEHSVYIHPQHRGKGLGLALMRELIAAAQAQQLHVLVGAIDAGNQASIALHQKLGFEHAGTVKQVGFKFGRWLDLALYQLILPTPEQPSSD